MKRKPASSLLSAADRFSGLTGFFKQWASLGVIGLVCGIMVWKIMLDDPAQRELLLKTVGDERTVSRDEQDKSRKHGNDAAKTLAEAINRQTGVIEANQQRVAEHEAKVRANQENLIRIQAELLKGAKP